MLAQLWIWHCWIRMFPDVYLTRDVMKKCFLLFTGKPLLWKSFTLNFAFNALLIIKQWSFILNQHDKNMFSWAHQYLKIFLLLMGHFVKAFLYNWLYLVTTYVCFSNKVPAHTPFYTFYRSVLKENQFLFDVLQHALLTAAKLRPNAITLQLQSP